MATIKDIIDGLPEERLAPEVEEREPVVKPDPDADKVAALVDRLARPDLHGASLQRNAQEVGLPMRDARQVLAAYKARLTALGLPPREVRVLGKV